ncbi:ER degradation-enhancing alpha-mannosidase 2 isoform X1 [Brachionus plicatilis]|uniref:alpha-1,2-Mannosidase n=1 Tax=Brachionus plicatilis TaxID=10195 RepID=A0A3M7SAG5_BRAPC|nr:ER degradation-enhancing alpha-mannosidase 2 isoform X1 [Brachionus plicatilis]
MIRNLTAILLVLAFSSSAFCVEQTISSLQAKSINLDDYKDRVKEMFYHAYDSYIYNAYPYDELKPISCQGFDTWGSYSLTLIDALDMLIILGNRTEFERVSNLLEKTISFDKDINVSVFETNIRVIGGLIAAHLLSYRLYLKKNTNELDVTKIENLDPEWPCNGPLLRLAVKAADKILPAFDTPTGMPYGTVNLKNGVPKGETPVTCVAGVGTFLVEFSALSRLTGDKKYEEAAMKAMDALWNHRSSINLLGNHINTVTGQWTGTDATIGSGVDSYFEYLVKAGIMLNKPELIEQFHTFQRAIDKYLLHDNWVFWANMNSGKKTLPLFSSLEAFYPSVLILVGNLQQAIKLIDNYHTIWRQYGGLPEFFNIQSNTIHNNREAYPLRPELIESLMYIIKAKNYDQKYVEMAIDYLESIDRISRLECGFATIKDVRDHKLDDRMESFFLAETLKYLYLIFDRGNFLHNDISSSDFRTIKNSKGECVIETGFFFFNTEAHPIDGASLECCQILGSEEDEPELLPQLIDGYIESKSGHYLLDDLTKRKYFKTLNQEYEEFKQILREEEEKEAQEHQHFCKNKEEFKNIQKETSLSVLRDKGHDFPFTCFLNDSFNIHINTYNSFSYFP